MEFPVKQGKNREILHFYGFSGLSTGLYPAQILDFLIKFPTHKNREIILGIREFIGPYQGITGKFQGMGSASEKRLLSVPQVGVRTIRITASWTPMARWCRTDTNLRG